MRSVGLSPEEKESRRNHVKSVISEIDEIEVDLKICETEIDWGSSRGQGKRVGSSVKGSMSDISIRGVKKYQGIDMGEFVKDETRGDIKLLLRDGVSGWVCSLYMKARKFGLDHWSSMYFALARKQGSI